MYHGKHNIRKCYLSFGFLSVFSGAGTAVAAPSPDAVLAALAADARFGAEVSPVYEARGGAAIWLDGDAARARALVDALGQAPARALPPARYDAAGLAARLDAPGGTDDATLEVDLSRVFATYARDLKRGFLPPSSAGPDMHRRIAREPARTLLAEAADAPDIAAFLRAREPADDDYRGLIALYAELTAKAAAGDWGATVAEGPTLREGDRDPRVAALRARLERMGYHPSDAIAAEPDLFDVSLAVSLRAFQARHGLNEDAALGPRTRAAVNASAARRAEQTAVNIERARWLNMPLGTDNIVVNIPAYRVTLTRGGDVAFDERVVVGSLKYQTPEFSDEMQTVVFNPSWNVPRSITMRDILPRLRADPGYLSRNGMRLIPTDGGPPPDPASHDFSYYDASYFPFRVQQVPNDDNALGLVKFLFPNDFAIYLHDTPKKSLFARDARAFSNGCIRVQDPLRLAELLFAPQVADPFTFIQEQLGVGRERFVQLRPRVPVHLIYRTVTIAPDEKPFFHADIYGRDARVLEAMRQAGVAAPES